MTAPILLPIDVPTGEIAVRGPFDLCAASHYLAGFGPAARPDAASEPGVLRLAFPWTASGPTPEPRSARDRPARWRWRSPRRSTWRRA